jgi:hypothetical protein
MGQDGRCSRMSKLLRSTRFQSGRWRWDGGKGGGWTISSVEIEVELLVGEGDGKRMTALDEGWSRDVWGERNELCLGLAHLCLGGTSEEERDQANDVPRDGLTTERLPTF